MIQSVVFIGELQNAVDSWKQKIKIFLMNFKEPSSK